MTRLSALHLILNVSTGIAFFTAFLIRLRPTTRSYKWLYSYLIFEVVYSLILLRMHSGFSYETYFATYWCLFVVEYGIQLYLIFALIKKALILVRLDTSRSLMLTCLFAAALMAFVQWRPGSIVSIVAGFAKSCDIIKLGLLFGAAIGFIRMKKRALSVSPALILCGIGFNAIAELAHLYTNGEPRVAFARACIVAVVRLSWALIIAFGPPPDVVRQFRVPAPAEQEHDYALMQKTSSEAL